jgi:prevent-host-death family protein
MPLSLTSREFNQDTARAKREAAKGPVFVTERGRTTHVLLTVEEYRRLSGPKRSILDLLHDPASAHAVLPLPDRPRELPRDADLGDA